MGLEPHFVGYPSCRSRPSAIPQPNATQRCTPFAGILRPPWAKHNATMARPAVSISPSPSKPGHQGSDDDVRYMSIVKSRPHRQARSPSLVPTIDRRQMLPFLQSGTATRRDACVTPLSPHPLSWVKEGGGPMRTHSYSTLDRLDALRRRPSSQRVLLPLEAPQATTSSSSPVLRSRVFPGVPHPAS